MLNRRLPEAYFLGSWIWLYVRGPDCELLISIPFPQHSCGTCLAPIRQCRKVSQRPDTRQEEVSTTSHGRKRRQARDLLPNGSLRDGHVESSILCAKDRIAFVAQLVKIGIVSPYVHRKLKLAYKTCAADERRNAPLH